MPLLLLYLFILLKFGKLVSCYNIEHLGKAKRKTLERAGMLQFMVVELEYKWQLLEVHEGSKNKYMSCEVPDTKDLLHHQNNDCYFRQLNEIQ